MPANPELVQTLTALIHAMRQAMATADTPELAALIAEQIAETEVLVQNFAASAGANHE